VIWGCGQLQPQYLKNFKSSHMLRYLIELAARKYKGPCYRLDESIPTQALLAIGGRRLIALARCVVFGVKFSLNPKNLVFVGPNTRLRSKSQIRFGTGVTLGEGVVIDGLSRNGVQIGNNVNIGPYTIIEATGVISNLGSGCTIGSNSGIGAFSFVGAAGGVRIGCDVIMGQRVSFHSENHNFDRLDQPIREQGTSRQGIAVDDNCWIGANVVFLDGAHVGSGSVVAAGAVVRGVFPANAIIAGVPAKLIRLRDGDAGQSA
jgi:acetyltransferase-like isoleucine patch superfamily enzyme